MNLRLSRLVSGWSFTGEMQYDLVYRCRLKSEPFRYVHLGGRRNYTITIEKSSFVSLSRYCNSSDSLCIMDQPPELACASQPPSVPLFRSRGQEITAQFVEHRL